MPHQFKWSKYSTEKFKRALRNKEIVSQISSFLSTQFETDDDGIDSACSKFEDIVISVAEQSLSRKRVNCSKQHRSKKWYDEKLYIKRRDLNRKASNMFEEPFNKSLRNSYFKCYSNILNLLNTKRKILPNQLFHS